MKYDYETAVGHGVCTGSKMFLVSVYPKPGICYQFTTIALDPDDACERVIQNATAVVNVLKTTLQPSDFKAVQWFSDPTTRDLKRSKELDAENTTLREEFDNIASREDELAQVRREIIHERLTTNQSEISRLRAMRPEKNKSRFEVIASRILDILAPETVLRGMELDSGRVYAVSYFDDSRSYLNHCP